MKIAFTLGMLALGALAAGCTKEAAASSGPHAPDTAATADESCGGCGQEEAVAHAATTEKGAGSEAGCGGCAEGAMTTTDALAPTKGITLAEFTPISEILAAPGEFEGKRVLVKGEVVGICAKRGCWVMLKSEVGNDKALRVKVEDGEIVFPLTISGHEVVAEGIIEKLVTPEDAYREMLRTRAEAKGEAFDPGSVTGPLVTWRLRGLGARWES